MLLYFGVDIGRHTVILNSSQHNWPPIMNFPAIPFALTHTHSLAYDDTAKNRFHSSARWWLFRLADALNMEPGTYDVRSNKAGIAVSGEVTLHGDNIYVQISEWSGFPGLRVLYRSVTGRRDFVGGPNHTIKLSDLIGDKAALFMEVLSDWNRG